MKKKIILFIAVINLIFFPTISLAEDSSVSAQLKGVFSAQEFEMTVKKEIIANKLMEEGKIDSVFIENVLKSDILEPEVVKTLEGYRFITGKEGMARAALEKTTFLISADPIPDMDIEIPAIIDLSNFSSAVIPVFIKKGSGQVVTAVFNTEDFKDFQKASGQKKNYPDKLSEVTLLVFNKEGMKRLPWANVTVQLKKKSANKGIALISGWNLVTLTAIPDKIYTGKDLLGEIAAQGGYATTVSTLVDGSWKTYVIRGDKDFSSSSDNFSLEVGRAYFVKALKTSQFAYSGRIVTDPVKLKLNSGWNAVGFPKTSKSYKASDLPADTTARWESGLWDTFVLRDKQKFGEDFAIAGNRGYILKVGKEGEFSP